METLVTDIGNFSCLAAVVDTENPPITKMRSLIYDCTHHGEIRNGFHSEDSPLVEVKGKTYKLGKQARKQPGHLSAAEAGKNQPEIFLPLLLANTPDGFEGAVSMLIPEFNSASETWIRTAVMGYHSYSVNKSSRTANFTDIKFYRESDVAVKYAYLAGIVPQSAGILAVDCGGGTTNAVIATWEDDELSILWRQSYENSGGIAIAQAIASTDFVKSQGKAMEVAAIMDAIAEGRRYVGNRPDRTFEPVFDDCVTNWFKAIRTRIMAAADKYLDEVNYILWMGGTAELLRPRLEGKEGQIVFPDAQLANIKALIHTCTNSPARQAA